MSEAIRRLRSGTIVLPWRDIDTDQIYPARFLTTTSRQGLGRHAFADQRYGPEGRLEPEFALNRVDLQAHRVLVAGSNFGCGSSREHAVWALLDLGIRAVISDSIADIFRSNALKNGLLAIVVDRATHDRLLANPGIAVEIDIEARELRFEGHRVGFPLEAFTRYCLLRGMNELEFLIRQAPRIGEFERTRAPLP